MPLRHSASSRDARQIFSAVLLLLLCLIAGCKKNPPATVPPQANAPAPTAPEVSVTPSPKPVEPPAAEAAPATPENTPPKPATKPTHRAKPRSSQKTSQKTEAKEPQPAAPGHGTNSTEAAAAAEASPPNEQIGNKVIVRDGSTNPPPGQISTAVPDTEEARTRRNTETLLEETEKNIRALNRVLNGEEQAMLAQVRTFIQQSKGATSDGDTMRANNLAQKAQLLSAELVRKK